MPYVKPAQTIPAHTLKITLSFETGSAALPIVDPSRSQNEVSRTGTAAGEKPKLQSSAAAGSATAIVWPGFKAVPERLYPLGIILVLRPVGRNGRWTATSGHTIPGTAVAPARDHKLQRTTLFDAIFHPKILLSPERSFSPIPTADSRKVYPGKTLPPDPAASTRPAQANPGLFRVEVESFPGWGESFRHGEQFQNRYTTRNRRAGRPARSRGIPFQESNLR